MSVRVADDEAVAAIELAAREQIGMSLMPRSALQIGPQLLQGQGDVTDLPEGGDRRAQPAQAWQVGWRAAFFMLLHMIFP